MAQPIWACKPQLSIEMYMKEHTLIILYKNHLIYTIITILFLCKYICCSEFNIFSCLSCINKNQFIDISHTNTIRFLNYTKINIFQPNFP